MIKLDGLIHYAVTAGHFFPHSPVLFGFFSCLIFLCCWAQSFKPSIKPSLSIPVISKKQGTSALLPRSSVLAFVFTEVKIHVQSKRLLTLWIFHISHLKMTRKQTHPRGPLLYLSQSEGVLAALWLSGGCQISSASTCQFTLENARRYLWWAVQSCITDKSLKKEQKDGVFSSIFKESEKSFFILFHL